jgi:hypothetical protein
LLRVTPVFRNRFSGQKNRFIASGRAYRPCGSALSGTGVTRFRSAVEAAIPASATTATASAPAAIPTLGFASVSLLGMVRGGNVLWILIFGFFARFFGVGL